MSTVRCVFHDRAQLGEGPLWSSKENKLYWVDIDGCRVCRFDPESGENVSVDVGQQVGAIVESVDGGLIAGLKDGVYRLDFATGELKKQSDPMNGEAENRFNDGKVGPDGRLYIGTMGAEGLQFLYRVEKDAKTCETIERGLSCSNGLAWNANMDTMYFIDSPQRVVWAYDFDLATGAVDNRRVVVDATDGDPFPDGMTIDEEGMLWVAFWQGWAVRRYDPANGRLLAEIKLPVARVTSCAFGGENLDTLYITTASVGFGDEDWKREPQAGGLFAVKPGVRGTPSILFGA